MKIRIILKGNSKSEPIKGLHPSSWKTASWRRLQFSAVRQSHSPDCLGLRGKPQFYRNFLSCFVSIGIPLTIPPTAPAKRTPFELLGKIHWSRLWDIAAFPVVLKLAFHLLPIRTGRDLWTTFYGKRRNTGPQPTYAYDGLYNTAADSWNQHPFYGLNEVHSLLNTYGTSRVLTLLETECQVLFNVPEIFPSDWENQRKISIFRKWSNMVRWSGVLTRR